MNWGRIGFYRATVGANKVIKTITHVYAKVSVNIEKENITDDFLFEYNWNPKQALLVKGSRRHLIFDFFSTDDKKGMAPWSGLPKGLVESANAATAQLKEKSDANTMHIKPDELLKETHVKKSAAIAAARDKLAKAKEESAKKRRISVAESKVDEPPVAAAAPSKPPVAAAAPSKPIK